MFYLKGESPVASTERIKRQDLVQSSMILLKELRDRQILLKPSSIGMVNSKRLKVPKGPVITHLLCTSKAFDLGMGGS